MLKEKIEQVEKMVGALETEQYLEMVKNVQVLDFEQSEIMAQEVINFLCEKHDCDWWYAYEDMNGSLIMSLMGVCDEVCDEWAQSI
jgi:hypothetical protein